MNVQITASKNGLESPLNLDDNNGNEVSERKNIPRYTKFEWNVNLHGQGVSDCSYLEHQRENECNRHYSVESPNSLELDSTLDYIDRAAGDCDTLNLKTNKECKISISCQHPVDTEQDETVDYINNESFKAQNVLSCPPDTQTCRSNEITKDVDKFTNMQSVFCSGQTAPCMQESTDVFLCNMEPQRTHEAEIGTRDAKFVCNSSFDFLSLSLEYSDEMCLRKSSLVSSGSEKPLSASVLEGSALTNTSIDVFTGTLKKTDIIPSLCQGAELSTKDFNYLEVPLFKDSKERRQNKISLTSEHSVFTNDNSDLLVELKICRPVQNVKKEEEDQANSNQNHLKTKNRDNGQLKEENNPQLNGTDNCIKNEDANGVYTGDPHSLQSPNRAESSSAELKELLNLTGQNLEETFIVSSPKSAAETKRYTSTPLPESKNITFSVPVLESIAEIKPQKHNVGCDREEIIKSCPVPHAIAKVTNKTAVTALLKAKKNEVVNFPKPNFRNVKAKVLTRPSLQTRESGCRLSPRSPPSSSNTSSPSQSPRQLSSAFNMGRKKSGIDRDLKAETDHTKSPKQPINKHLFPRQAAHVPTQSKHALGKVPRTTILKHSQDELERASSSNSTRSSGSAAVLTCTAGSRVTENKSEKTNTSAKLSELNPEHMGPDRTDQNGIILPPFDKAETLRDIKDARVSGNMDILANVVPLPSKLAIPGSRNLRKELLLGIKNATSQQMSSAKTRTQTSDQRRGSIGRNILARVSSSNEKHQATVGGAINSPRRKSISVKASTPIGTTSFTRSRVPCTGATLQRAASVSSMCSTLSEQSTLSTRSTATTSSIKTEEVPPAKYIRPNSASGTLSTKPTFPRGRSQSLKVTQTGTKKSPCATQSYLRLSSSSVPLAKKVDPKVGQKVEKNKQKTSSKVPVPQAQTPPVDPKYLELTQCKAECEEQRGIIQNLKDVLTTSNRRFEALTLVVQQLINQHEETIRKRKELSEELIGLRGDLVSASSTCEKLEKEKNDLLIAYDGILQKVKEEHRAELEDLEEKLKQFYTGECEKLQSIFIEEAEKYKNELQEKVDDLNSTQESLRLEAETKHIETINTLKEDYDKSFTELKGTHEKERRELEESFKDKHDEIEKRIAELKQENESLKEKLKCEEEQRKLSKEKSVQKNPQVMYLEQELESLKAVLEIKNEKLHQQDKKLMQIEKLVETNTTLVERLNKCQQENEDLRARMASHIALSRQLSTEQEVLQRSLDKESKANKRLSMENEELLWKLHNGDLCSPKKLSPSSPGIPFSPSRNSGAFSSPTVSPR
ncbi:hypothetical protein GDO86_000387 [Hymenochirus boettgeri]|nr:hypothetical protein GDO86_000387 [Hymenochirus boettgeri]